MVLIKSELLITMGMVWLVGLKSALILVSSGGGLQMATTMRAVVVVTDQRATQVAQGVFDFSKIQLVVYYQCCVLTG